MEFGVYFHGYVKDVTGGADFVAEVPDRSTVRDLVDLLVLRYGDG